MQHKILLRNILIGLSYLHISGGGGDGAEAVHHGDGQGGAVPQDEGGGRGGDRGQVEGDEAHAQQQIKAN